MALECKTSSKEDVLLYLSLSLQAYSRSCTCSDAPTAKTALLYSLCAAEG